MTREAVLRTHSSISISVLYAGFIFSHGHGLAAPDTGKKDILACPSIEASKVPAAAASVHIVTSHLHSTLALPALDHVGAAPNTVARSRQPGSGSSCLMHAAPRRFRLRRPCFVAVSNLQPPSGLVVHESGRTGKGTGSLRCCCFQEGAAAPALRHLLPIRCAAVRQIPRHYRFKEGAAAPAWRHLLPTHCVAAHDPASLCTKGPAPPLNRSVK
jgi:hypothetical protein